MTTAEFEAELRDVFVEESRQLVGRIERALMQLEEGTEGDDQDAMKTLHRALHTLKGAAGAIGSQQVVQVCHSLEEGLSRYAQAEQRLDDSAFDAAYEALALIEEWIEGSTDRNMEQTLGELEEGFAPSARPVDQSDRKAQSQRDDGESDNQGDGEPSPNAPSPSPSPKQPHHEGSATTLRRDSAVRVGIAKLDSLQAIASELVVLNLRQRENHNRIDDIRDGLAGALSLWRTMHTSLRELSDGLSSRRWRQMEHRASQIALQLKETYQASYDYARWGVGQMGRLERISEALEEGVQNIRMQPLSPFFEGFARVVRDAARSDDKQVRFRSHGGHIEVDRAVLDKLREPLIHLVRNAVAHGIEAEAERRRTDKPAVGTVRMRARAVGEQVELSVDDDGAGIDTDAIEQRAVQMGLFPSMEAARNRPLVELLTHPGLSTREKTDTVAGRGLGLEVVDAAVAELGGTLRVETTPGQGTRFRLTIPTSITTSEGLIVEAGAFRLGIQLDAVDRVVRIDSEQLQCIDDQQVIYHDERPITVRPLAELLGVGQMAPDLEEGTHQALVLRHNDRRLAVVVDAVPGQMPMVVKPMGPQFDEVHHLAGGAIQADGSILPVVEHRALFRVAAGQKSLLAGAGGALRWQSEQPRREEANEVGSATVLVVDDSITTRTLERNILEAAGHQVVAAKDGAEALEILRDRAVGDGIDLIVTDLEMPRVDGFELCRAVRDSPDFDLPVIVVTSRGEHSEVQRGLKAGADAYIVKGNFEQDHFMATVNRFVR